MTNEQILEKAIEKAVRNGWKKTTVSVKTMDEAINIDKEKYMWEGLCSLIIKEDSKFYFSHDFAKAFWGDESIVVPKNFMEAKSIKSWQYHLQQMVLEENRIKYLEKFV